MKKILYLIGFAILFTTTGCVIRERGGYYGHPEYERGHYREYPHRDWDDRGYWDRR